MTTVPQIAERTQRARDLMARSRDEGRRRRVANRSYSISQHTPEVLAVYPPNSEGDPTPDPRAAADGDVDDVRCWRRPNGRLTPRPQIEASLCQDPFRGALKQRRGLGA
jgi:hypothetical protein